MEDTMLIGELFYGIALLLVIYVIIDITSTGKVALPDVIAGLGVVVLIILALSIPSSSPRESVDNPMGDTTAIAGDWEGTIIGDTSDFSAELQISISTGCSIGEVCGTEKIPQMSCSSDLILVEISYGAFYFLEDSCGRGSAQITLFSNGSLSWIYQDGSTKSHATLNKK
jgi:hypothetical protein